jgi:glycosyltransferase involved in cell wall biosynthesis
MRIVFVNSARGVEGGLTATLDLGLGLAELGHDVTVVCHPGSAIRERLEGDPRVNLTPVAIRAELNPLRPAQLARISRRVGPDLVIADRRKDLKLSVAARWLCGRYPIVHRHGAPSVLKDTLIYRYFWGRELQMLIVNSHTMRRLLLEHAPWLERVPLRVIHNGKDVKRYRPLPRLRRRMRAELGISEDAFVVSFHGIVQPRKNVDLLVRAVAELPRDLHVVALVIGTGPSLADLRRQALELNAPVVFTGTRRDIPEVLSAADAAVHLSTAEGFANSVIEAMACELPVIATDTTSHPEQIDDGKHGLLVPPGRWQGVADAIRWLATDPAGRERMGKAARERVVAEFSRQRMLGRYDEVLREALTMYRG